MWSHLYTAQARVVPGDLGVEGEQAVAFSTVSHVARTMERPFTTPMTDSTILRHG
jgi:hypothetical protein